VGTTGGLNRFDRGTFHHITEANGLANNTINGILEDKNGVLWLSTNRGITSYNQKNKAIKNFDTKDGLMCREFNGRACFQTPQGEMFFGGNNGFTSFYGEEVEENIYIPPVVITSVKLFDKVLEKANPWLLPNSKESKTPLILSYQENFISFDFSALSYQLTERNQYSYMLEGIDEKWVSSESRRYANYSKVPPGEYVFRVKGSNSDGYWNEEDASIYIIIQPPFWQTRLAYFFYILFASGLIYASATYRLRVLHKRNILLESTVEQRTSELANALSNIKKNNEELSQAKEALEKNNQVLDEKNKQLDEKIGELINAQQRADRIFSALAEALPGTILEGKYRLEQRLGAGGFGVVYLATHLILEKRVAVKIFKPAPGNDSEESLERFKLEAVSTCKVNHPNAVTVLDSGISEEGIAYLVMELLTGSTLKAQMQHLGSFSPLRSAQILLPICQVLGKAHSLGIIHRDIKPDNIFLHEENGKEIVKILDFGIAKLMETQEMSDDISMPSKLIGTPAYISPERLTAMPYDGKADVYSVGVIFYEMLTGQLPFQRNTSGFLGLIQMHLTSTPPSVKSIKPGIPQEVSDIVASLLNPDATMRPTPNEVVKRLLDSLSVTLEELIDSQGYSVVNPNLTLGVSKSENEDAITIITTVPKNIDEQSRLAKRIFLSLSNLPIDEQDKALEQACIDNPELKKAVISLIKANEETKGEDFFNSSFDVQAEC
jgi:serine/threonine protein kinase